MFLLRLDVEPNGIIGIVKSLGEKYFLIINCGDTFFLLPLLLPLRIIVVIDGYCFKKDFKLFGVMLFSMNPLSTLPLRIPE